MRLTGCRSNYREQQLLARAYRRLTTTEVDRVMHGRGLASTTRQACVLLASLALRSSGSGPSSAAARLSASCAACAGPDDRRCKGYLLAVHVFVRQMSGRRIGCADTHTAAAVLNDLRQNGECDLLRRHCTDIEAGRGREGNELFLRDALGHQQLAQRRGLAVLTLRPIAREILGGLAAPGRYPMIPSQIDSGRV